MSDSLWIVALHVLPGRTRVRLSAPPRDVERFIAAVKEHDGLEAVRFTDLTRSVLVHYQPGHLTTEEVLLRIALAFSIEYDVRPVHILPGPDDDVMTDSAVIAALALAAAAFVRWSAPGKTTLLIEKMAGLTTGAAVLQHGWREFKRQGAVDPEVLSLAYLVASVFRDTWLKGAAVTWATCFGRHLLAEENAGVEVRPGASGGPETVSYRVIVSPRSAPQAPLFGIARSMMRYLASGGTFGGGNLFEELQNVSRAHGEVIEGFGAARSGVPLTFK